MKVVRILIECGDRATVIIENDTNDIINDIYKAVELYNEKEKE